MAFHPSRKVGDFQVMGGVSLKELKEHTNAVGGAFGDDTLATLVRDSALDVTEVEGEDSLDDTQAKRALLVPLNVWQSDQIRRMAIALGQTEDHKKFGVDEETPSGVEDVEVRNSTATSGIGTPAFDLSAIPAQKLNA